MFGFVDVNLLLTNVLKVPTGAWFTLVLAALASIFFLVWYLGHEHKLAAIRRDCSTVTEESLQGVCGAAKRIPDTCVFFESTAHTDEPTEMTTDERVVKPRLLARLARRMHILPRTSIIVMVGLSDSQATVPAAERIDHSVVNRDLNVHLLNVRYGFMEDVSDLPDQLYAFAADPQVAGAIQRSLSRSSAAPAPPTVAVEGTVTDCVIEPGDSAHDDLTFIVGLDVVTVDATRHWYHRILIHLYEALDNITVLPHLKYQLPASATMTIGTALAI